ncbi:hypothetical protein [Paracidovorax wautersii]|uniref:Integrase n=1 Tax=Paracidovorax wautersii TaxID=1177982 RepID=A0ABU1IFI7_9BURK|nr:hypothetical protein [Paracidovorax wautersii]MDR6215989.1 hypothetical protein [Paracidovorax wautersii]
MSLYKRENSPYWWIRLAPIKGELKPLQISSGTANKRQAQQYHDKLKAERWEQDKLDVKPRRTWDDAAERFLMETTHKRSGLGQVHAALVPSVSRGESPGRNQSGVAG